MGNGPSFSAQFWVALALSCGATLIGAGPLSAQARAPDSTTRRSIDLILIIDQSRSMNGAGGARRIFPQVREAAKHLIGTRRKGDNVVVVSYDSAVRVSAPVLVYDEQDRESLRRSIDGLRPNGNWTYTAAAMSAAFAEAKRLDAAQGADPRQRHSKLLILITDGINDPPPGASAAGISYQQIAGKYKDMPWFVLQLQVGPEIDAELNEAFSGMQNYRAIKPGTIDSIIPGLDSQVKTGEAPTPPPVSEPKPVAPPQITVEPNQLAFGSVTRGSSKTLKFRVASTGSAGDTSVARLQFVFSDSLAESTLKLSETSAVLHVGDSREISVVFQPGSLSTLGHTTGSIRVVVAPPIDSTAAAPQLTWSATTTPPAPRWPWAVAAGLAIILVIAALVVRSNKRARLHGTLSYWTQGTPPARIDLASYQRQQVRIGNVGSCAVAVAFSPPGAVVFVSEPQDGWIAVAVQPEASVPLRLGDKQVASIILHDRDLFQMGNISCEYRGETPRRSVRG